MSKRKIGINADSFFFGYKKTFPSCPISLRVSIIPMPSAFRFVSAWTVARKDKENARTMRYLQPFKVSLCIKYPLF